MAFRWCLAFVLVVFLRGSAANTQEEEESEWGHAGEGEKKKKISSSYLNTNLQNSLWNVMLIFSETEDHHATGFVGKDALVKMLSMCLMEQKRLFIINCQIHRNMAPVHSGH